MHDDTVGERRIPQQPEDLFAIWPVCMRVADEMHVATDIGSFLNARMSSATFLAGSQFATQRIAIIRPSRRPGGSAIAGAGSVPGITTSTFSTPIERSSSASAGPVATTAVISRYVRRSSANERSVRAAPPGR